MRKFYINLQELVRARETTTGKSQSKDKAGKGKLAPPEKYRAKTAKGEKVLRESSHSNENFFAMIGTTVSMFTIADYVFCVKLIVAFSTYTIVSGRRRS